MRRLTGLALLVASAALTAGCGDFDIERYVKYREKPEAEATASADRAHAEQSPSPQSENPRVGGPARADESQPADAAADLYYAAPAGGDRAADPYGGRGDTDRSQPGRYDGPTDPYGRPRRGGNQADDRDDSYYADAGSPNRSPARPAQRPDYAADGGSSPRASGAWFRLRTGTALPQTLPDGTALGASVEYELEGTVPSSSRYIWVIESSRRRAEIPLTRIQATDTLYTFLSGWQPTEAPFRCHIAEIVDSGERRRVSDVEPLR